MVLNLSVATLLFNCVIKHIPYKRKQENLQHQLLWKEGIPYYMMVVALRENGEKCNTHKCNITCNVTLMLRIANFA